MSFQQGLSGLRASSQQLDALGNNVANSNTVGFKESQTQFADVFAASLSGGGGVQVGTGVKVSAIVQQFTQGNVTNTGNALDTAISGQGFFRLVNANGAIVYSRNGQFQLDKDGFIINSQGDQVSGYLPDASGVITTAQAAPLQISSANLAPRPTSNLATGGVPIQVGVNLDSRAVFPSGLIQGTATGSTPAGVTITAGSAATSGSVDTGAAVTVFDYSTDSISFDVDATTVTLNTDDTDINGVVTDIQAQLGGTYNVTQSAGVITIAKVATGTAAPVISNYNGDVDGNTTSVADVITGGTSTAGVAAVVANNTFTVTVDGTTSGTVTIPSATYATADALASAVETAVNADATLSAAGLSVVVTADSTGTMTLTSSSAGPNSSVSVANVAAGTVANLLGVPTTTTGSGVFNSIDPSTYNNSTSLTVYDSLGTDHIASLYFQRADVNTNTWNVYLTLDGASLPAAGTPLTTFVFNAVGHLVAPVGPPVGQVTSSVFTPSGAAAQTLTFDFNNSSQYGGAFGVNSLTQDGYTSGQLNGFSTSPDGVILGRYSNGQTRALGQLLLANFSNVQGLQPIGNNEWVESFSSGAPLLGVPGSASLGVLQSSAVEDSNVDLTAELVNMITAQRTYQANAQTIKAQDQILQTLVNL